MDFYDRTLLKLKRQYGKDEVVAALSKKLSDAEIEIGKLKSEIDFLLNELNFDKENKEIIRLGRIEARKDDLYNNKVEECIRLKKEIKRLKNNNSELITKLIAKK